MISHQEYLKALKIVTDYRTQLDTIIDDPIIDTWIYNTHMSNRLFGVLKMPQFKGRKLSTIQNHEISDIKYVGRKTVYEFFTLRGY